MAEKFKLVAPYEPTGDQPQAIAKLLAGIERGEQIQTLMGVTGSGKTYVASNVIEKLQRPTLVIAHNKTLAAQLYNEFKRFFPDNAVRYFVSYYDYYQPEAYVPSSDLYIEKDAMVNDEIDRLRHAATSALLTRKDVLVVASVSCIYGLGSPATYKQSAVTLNVGETWSQRDLLRILTDGQYERNDVELRRGTFRVKGDTVEVFPAYEDALIRVSFFGDVIEKIERRDAFHNKRISESDTVTIFPAKHYVAAPENFQQILSQIRADMEREVGAFTKNGQPLEAERLRMRTEQDLEMLEVAGTVSGIENYSRYFDQRAPGSPPSTLLDFFPKDFLLFVDESHMTLSQVQGMYNGDRARKDTLIQYGFRLQAARDNRPLRYDEFKQRVGQRVYVSATPGPEERSTSTQMVEQIIRPTGLLDPVITIQPTENQIDNVLERIQDRIKRGQRTLVTTLTKRMSEELTEYLHDLGIKVAYIHSDVETLERSDILRDLRMGKYDVLVGINLLREGLDLPEVSQVLILDADKEGFLRSATALIQTIGRAARHSEGEVVMYSDRITNSMRQAIDETNRRRAIQEKHNQEYGITPRSITGDIHAKIVSQETADEERIKADLPPDAKKELARELRAQMDLAAANLEFERAATLRDEIAALEGKPKPTQPAPQSRGRGARARR